MAFKLPSLSSPKQVHRDIPYIFSYKTIPSSATSYIKNTLANHPDTKQMYNKHFALENLEAKSSLPHLYRLLSDTKLKASIK